MVITLSIFYYLYLAVVAVFILYSLFNIYHLLVFGFTSFINILIIALYVAVAIILINFSLNQLAAVDWSRPLIDFSANNYLDLND